MASTTTITGDQALAAADGGQTFEDITWRDPKRYAWLLGLLVPLIPTGAILLHEWTGSPVSWWFGPIMIFAFFPFVDSVLGFDRGNPPEGLMDWLEEDRYYRWVTYLFLPLQYATLVWSCWLWAYGDLSVVDKVGLAFSVAMVSGIAIAVAHELGHKKVKLERWLSKIALAQSAYGHFFIEHNRGHHVRVATPEDPASSRMGENFWEFLPRTVVGSVRSAWHLEKARLQRLNKSPWTLSNDVLNAWLMTVVLYVVLLAVFGIGILPYLLIQSAAGFALLEVVNYLEHYGLLRQKKEDGRYERVLPEHSWNSCNRWSNILLYHLQRHSDHHANPTRRYQALLHVEEAPQLPSGYATMIVFAMVPPLWTWVMDKRLVEHYGGRVELTNMNPRKRNRLLKKYGRTEAAAQAGIAA